MPTSESTTMERNEASAHASGKLFPDTQWSAVRRARGDDSGIARDALNSLCERYWKPVFWYIRHLGQGEQDAEDLTQEFFHELAAKRNLFAHARRGRGKLRTYVCVAVKRRVANAARDRQRLKRGGDLQQLTFELTPQAEHATDDEEQPDHQFDRRWAKALIEATLDDLAAEYRECGKQDLFDALRPSLAGDATGSSQSDIARDLGISVGALRMSLSRLRRRFGQSFRAKVLETVGSEMEAAEEIRYLASLYSQGT